VRRLALALLSRMREGSLTVVEDGRRTELGRGAPHATIEVHDASTWRALLRGSRGLAESYADGLWDSPDLTALIRLAARNAAQLDAPRRASPISACAPSATRRAAAATTSPPTTTSATSCSS
jgi:cyclopropane-fatty-acyl-phospholipid synthase